MSNNILMGRPQNFSPLPSLTSSSTSEPSQLGRPSAEVKEQIEKPKDLQIKKVATPRVHANLASQLNMAPTTKSGRSISPGLALAYVLRAPGKGLRRLGLNIQGTHNQRFSTAESKARYFSGGIFKTIGNFLGGTAGLVGGVIVKTEHAIRDYGGFALRLAGAGLLGGAGVAKLAAGHLAQSDQLQQSGLNMLHSAKVLVTDAPLMLRNVEQSIDVSVAKKYLADVQAVHNDTGRPLRDAEFPVELISIKGGHQIQKNEMTGESVIRTGGWSDVTITPSWSKDSKISPDPSQPKTLYLNFQGTNFTGLRHGEAQGLKNIRTDLVQALGVPDTAFREARDVVKAFAEKYKDQPNVSIRIVGHSMGGALAQFAGLAASTPDKPIHVTCFNSMGLHPHLLEKLGGDRINDYGVNVIHFSNKDDGLKQVLALAGLKVGVQYQVPASGHGSEAIQQYLSSEAAKA
jgi:hypothetical protein